MSKKTIIYILGLGRSGTTLLDILLGNQNGIFSAGELTRYPVEKGEPLNFPKEHSTNLFWQDIKEQMSEKYTDSDYSYFAKLRFRFEYHLYFFLNYLGLLSKEKRSNYIGFVTSVFEVIFNSIDEDTIVDSSKYPSRAITLHFLDKERFNVKYLMIKRHPVPFVNSYLKRDIEQTGKNWFMANLYYFVAMRLCKYSISFLSKRHECSIISHENIINDFTGTINKIEQELNVNMGDIRYKYINGNSFDVGKIFYGNRVRLKNNVSMLSEKPKTQPENLFEKVTKMVNQPIYNKLKK